MTQEKLQEILEKHSKWLNDEADGERADLRGVDLRDVSLRNANLRGADLSGANLRSANLRSVDFSGVDLRSSDLRWGDFSGANLSGADFSGANLCGASLRSANLCFASLIGANLSSANLRDADLFSADLRDADLTNAIYTGTALNLQCPEEGCFIAWKKLADNKIAKLLIPGDAKRSSGTSRKCRASKAIVLEIYNEDGEEISEGRSRHDYEFIYRVLETVYPDHWDEDRWNACSNGIHFFITRKEAEEY